MSVRLALALATEDQVVAGLASPCGEVREQRRESLLHPRLPLGRVAGDDGGGVPFEFYTGIADIVANDKSVLAEVSSDRRSEAQVPSR